MKEFWTEKYRPSSPFDYIFHNESLKQQVQGFLETKNIPNLFLSGAPGTGKSSLARFLGKSVVEDIQDLKIINASINNKVEFIDNTIREFISTYSIGPYKVVILEEADYLSLSAQAVLRSYTEDYSDSVRFIITCNYSNKIMPAIKSRFIKFEFESLPYEEIATTLVSILKRENIKPDLDVIDECVNFNYPDMRSIIMSLQNSVVDGKLIKATFLNTSADWEDVLLTQLKNKKFDEVVSIIQKDIADNQFEAFYTTIYQGASSFGWKPADVDVLYVLLSQYLYQHSFVANPQINAVGFIIQLKQSIK